MILGKFDINSKLPFLVDIIQKLYILILLVTSLTSTNFFTCTPLTFTTLIMYFKINMVLFVEIVHLLKVWLYNKLGYYLNKFFISFFIEFYLCTSTGRSIQILVWVLWSFKIFCTLKHISEHECERNTFFE